MADSWLKIKNDYINGGGSYRKLAEKHQVSFQTLRQRAKAEGWVALREKQRHKISTRTAQKTAEKVAEREANRIANILRMSDSLSEQLDRAIGELDRQMVKNKTKVREVEYGGGDAMGKPVSETITETEEVEIVEGSIDRQGLQQLSIALKNIKDTITAVDSGEGETLRRARELLEGVGSVI